MSRTTARVLAGLSSAALLAGTTAGPAAAAPVKPRPTAACADKLCKRNTAGVDSCWERANGHRARASRCFIKRAARHYDQPRRLALHIAWRESRYDFRVTNSSSGAAGLYQFMRVTWRSTPYREHSRYNPRWASLAAMWMWSRGGYYHWRVG